MWSAVAKMSVATGRSLLRDLIELPADLPPHPRVFVTREEILRIRDCREEAWVRAATRRLLDAADQEYEPVGDPGKVAFPEKNNIWIRQCKRQALAYHLTDNPQYFDRAIKDLRVLAQAYLTWPLREGHIRAASYGLSESRITMGFAAAYDLLAAADLEAADRDLFEEALAFTRETTDRCQHFTCGNHNTWNLAARLAVGIALGSQTDIHDALWGWTFEGKKRYGFVHQLRHDLLSDGLHWERTPGYHFYSLMALTELVCMFQHIGLDFWTMNLPAQDQDDGEDHHRAYGPQGEKSFKAAFDAPFFLSMGDGDLSLIHDSGLENLRGVWIWGPLYELAYQAYGDPKYAWLISRIEATCKTRSERKFEDLPMSLQQPSGEFDFLRLERWPLPKGNFSIDDDTQISLSGKHEQASTLFPVTGVTVLRNGKGNGPVAHIHWGPHSAGHQSPGALHIDIHNGQERLTDAPRSGGYGDPAHLTWYRTTIAHNTVTVDGRSMKPYDAEGDSIWKSDSVKGGITDSELVYFQPGREFQACRVRNDCVYPGVTLDRTVILTNQYLLDVYRVISQEDHQYDYAMHVLGEPDISGEPVKADLGKKYGYRHFQNVRRWSGIERDCRIPWCCRGGTIQSWIRIPESGTLFSSEDPLETEGDHTLGGLEPLPARRNLIVRSLGKCEVFLSLWSFSGSGEHVDVAEAGGDTHVVLRVGKDGNEVSWTVPYESEPVEMGP